MLKGSAGTTVRCHLTQHEEEARGPLWGHTLFGPRGSAPSTCLSDQVFSQEYVPPLPCAPLGFSEQDTQVL